MEENNGSGSNKHQNPEFEVSNSSKHTNSDLEGTSSIDDQNVGFEVSNSSKHANSDLEGSSSIDDQTVGFEVSNSSKHTNSDLEGTSSIDDQTVGFEVSNSSKHANSDLEGSSSIDDQNVGFEVSNSSKHTNLDLEGTSSIDDQNVGFEASNSSKHDNSDLEGASSIGGQNERLQATNDDEGPVNHDKMVGDAFPTSLSSSRSSNLLEVDYDEKDALDVSFSNSEEDGSSADDKSPPDTSTSTPQWSMVSASPVDGPTIQGSSLSPETPPQTSGSDMANSSQMQSPVVQVMERTTSYDPNRIPSSTFSPKPTNRDWSETSNDSLFSLHNEKSGEFNRANDGVNHPCLTKDVTRSSKLASFSSGLPTVIETTSEIDRKSASTVGEAGEKEDLEIQSEPPIALTNEKETLHVSDGKEVNSAEPPNSGTTPRLSEKSGNTASSFAFPVMGGTSSTKSDSKTTPPPVPDENAVEATKSSDGSTTPKTGRRRCCSCFSCC